MRSLITFLLISKNLLEKMMVIVDEETEDFREAAIDFIYSLILKAANLVG